MPDDRELIERCLEGDEAAWELLVRRYRRLVYAVPMRMGMTAADADEVFQATFITLVGKLDTVRDRERIGLWLTVTARRKAIDLLRSPRSTRETELAEDLEVAAEVELAPDALIRLERRHQVRVAFEALSKRCRELLGALFFEDPTPSYKELSARFGLPMGSLSPTRSRCFDKLRRTLESQNVSSAGRRSSNGQ